MKTSPIQILAADGIDRARQVFGAARAVISDIDGVLLVSGRAVPGAGALLRRRRCALVSNNSTHTARTLRDVFAGAGLAAREQDFFLAGEAAVRAVHERFPGKSVLALASGEVLACARRTLPLAGADETPGVVLVCRDETLTFEKLQRAVNALRAGAAAVLANPDLTHPAAGGRVHLETGAIWALLAAACRRTQEAALVVGKPCPDLVRQALEHLAVAAQEAVFLGDTLQTDARAAAAAGVPFIHVGGEGFALSELVEGGSMAGGLPGPGDDGPLDEAPDGSERGGKPHNH